MSPCPLPPILPPRLPRIVAWGALLLALLLVWPAAGQAWEIPAELERFRAMPARVLERLDEDMDGIPDVIVLGVDDPATERVPDLIVHHRLEPDGRLGEILWAQWWDVDGTEHVRDYARRRSSL